MCKPILTLCSWLLLSYSCLLAQKVVPPDRISEKPYPTFPGGETALYAYLKAQIRYPETALAKKEEGRVRVSFIVEYDGSVSNVFVWEGVSLAINEEAARVVRNMPKWQQGFVEGHTVRGQYSIWVPFELPKTPQKEVKKKRN